MKIPRQMKEFSIQALDADCSVCMAAICYSHPIYKISSEITLLPQIIICAKFREDTSLNERVSHTNT